MARGEARFAIAYARTHSNVFALAELDKELSIAHNLVIIDLDGTAAGDHIDMDPGFPICPGELRIGIAKGHAGRASSHLVRDCPSDVSGCSGSRSQIRPRDCRSAWRRDSRARP